MIDKKKLIIMIVRRVVVATVFILIASVLSTTLKEKIKKIGDSVVENKKNSVILQRKSEMLAEIEKDMTIMGGNDTKIEQAYLPVDNILDFVSAIENLAAQSSSQHNIFFGNPADFVTKSDGTKIYSVEYSLTMSGTVYTLASFLKSFYALPYYASVSSVNINGSAEKGWEGVSSIAIKGKVYARQ